MDAKELASHLDGKKMGGYYIAKCPAHDDRKHSLSITDSDSGLTLFKCHAGCTQEAVIDALKDKGLWEKKVEATNQRSTIDKEYSYFDENGTLLYQCLRMKPKGFRQRKPVNGKWEWNLKGVKRVPYRLPELLASKKGIIICEGEKDADRLASLGVTSTTFPMGAGSYDTSYGKYFKGRNVYIVPDNDEPGLKHANSIAENLSSIASEIKIIRLPGLKEKQDVSDWLDAGNTKQQLTELILATPAHNRQITQKVDYKRPKQPTYHEISLGLNNRTIMREWELYLRPFLSNLKLSN